MQNKDVFTCTIGDKEFSVPLRMRKSLIDYVDHHEPVGNFLKAIITNNLFGAFQNADSENIDNIPAYINYFYNHAPAACWGSKTAYNVWINKKT